jgi:hypothetical protein
MFHQFYATTKDKSGHEHTYKLSAGEGVPKGHEITDLSVASRFKFADIIGNDLAKELKELFPVRKDRRAKA